MKSTRITPDQETGLLRAFDQERDPERKQARRVEVYEAFGWVPHVATKKYCTHSKYDDILQEARLAMYRSIDRYSSKHGCSFRTFAIRRAHGAAMDFMRANCSTIRVPRNCARRATVSLGMIESRDGNLDHVEPGAVHDFGDDGLGDAVVSELSRLPESFRRVMVGLYFRGQTLDAIATELGCTESNVGQTKKKALERLRMPTLRAFAQPV